MPEVARSRKDVVCFAHIPSGGVGAEVISVSAGRPCNLWPGRRRDRPGWREWWIDGAARAVANRRWRRPLAVPKP